MTTANTLVIDTGANLQVVSTPPVKIKETERVVAWKRRSTEKNPVAESERYRGVVIHADNLLIAADACTSKFHRLLQETIYSLADAAFQGYIEERMHEVEMPASKLSLDSVLAYWAEEKQKQTIDGEKITAWLKTSKTLAALPKATATIWLNKVPKIAAPSYKQNFSEAQAAAMVSKLHADEIEHPVAQFIAQRCNNILSDESKEAEL
jgi:predicted flavoprotein YhiN